jgi:hypothetical protein
MCALRESISQPAMSGSETKISFVLTVLTVRNTVLAARTAKRPQPNVPTWTFRG